MNKDKRDLEATKTALLEAAEKLMESCADPSDVTSRAITKEAGVSPAMINYCFGSREALLFRAFSSLKRRALECDPIVTEIMSRDIPPKEKLAELHFITVRMMLKNYKFAKAVIQYVLINRKIDDDRLSVRFISEHFGGRKTEGECRLIAHELSALHELLVLRHKDIADVCGIDLYNEETLKKIIKENINRFLN